MIDVIYLVTIRDFIQFCLRFLDGVRLWKPWCDYGRGGGIDGLSSQGGPEPRKMCLRKLIFLCIHLYLCVFTFVCACMQTHKRVPLPKDRQFPRPQVKLPHSHPARGCHDAQSFICFGIMRNEWKTRNSRLEQLVVRRVTLVGIRVLQLSSAVVPIVSVDCIWRPKHAQPSLKGDYFIQTVPDLFYDLLWNVGDDDHNRQIKLIVRWEW